jgi:hypothetical protein
MLLTPGATRVMRTSGAFYIAFATRMWRIWSVHHVYNICVGCARDAAPAACDTRVGCALLTRLSPGLSRVCRQFMYCRCRALLARRKCTGPWVTFGQYCIIVPRLLLLKTIPFEICQTTSKCHNSTEIFHENWCFVLTFEQGLEQRHLPYHGTISLTLLSLLFQDICNGTNGFDRCHGTKWYTLWSLSDICHCTKHSFNSLSL